MITTVVQIVRVQPMSTQATTGDDGCTGEGTIPHAVHTLILVPHYLKDKVKKDLNRDVCLGIIKIPQGTTTPWCAWMVVTPKKNGNPRRTVDLQKLDNAAFRETHHTPSSFQPFQ